MAEDDLRHFIVEVTRRHEQATDAVVAHLDDQRAVLGAQTQALVEMRKEIADQRRQIQANTQAVLSVLYRLN